MRIEVAATFGVQPAQRKNGCWPHLFIYYLICIDTCVPIVPIDVHNSSFFFFFFPCISQIDRLVTEEKRRTRGREGPKFAMHSIDATVHSCYLS